jgi:hypothetical protein
MVFSVETLHATSDIASSQHDNVSYCYVHSILLKKQAVSQFPR